MTNTHVTIRDRIKDFRRVPASELRRNPKNWRVHSDVQRDALRGVLAEIGFAGAALAYEAEDGALELIDGELRADEAGDQEIPVLILDVTADEAETLLATFDPIGAMADANDDVLRELLANREPEDADLRNLLAGLAASTERGSGPGGKAEDRAADTAMDLRPHEHYDHVIVLARTTQEWNRLCELLNLGITSRGRGSFKRMGIGRGIKASTLIELLENGNVSNRGAKQTSGKKRKENDRASA